MDFRLPLFLVSLSTMWVAGWFTLEYSFLQKEHGDVALGVGISACSLVILAVTTVAMTTQVFQHPLPEGRKAVRNVLGGFTVFFFFIGLFTDWKQLKVLREFFQPTVCMCVLGFLLSGMLVLSVSVSWEEVRDDEIVEDLEVGHGGFVRNPIKTIEEGDEGGQEMVINPFATCKVMY